MHKKTLIFPAGMPRSLAYLYRALSEGVSVIGSSSVMHDSARSDYPEWVYLPYITSESFDDCLSEVIRIHNISDIFTPNPVVWNYFKEWIKRSSQTVSLINGSPIDCEVAPYVQAKQFSKSVLENPLMLESARGASPTISELKLAALFRHSETIPGMCDHEKIRALCELFRYAPKGDVVEIGSWWGKSAYILMELASHYGVGSLLCVDPWSNEYLIQNDKGGLVDNISLNASDAFEIFKINLLPYASGNINYMRLPSVKAVDKYCRSQSVATDEFGVTNYNGGIAILHVDGNHSYENVRSDLLSWTRLVVPGGWIIVDDYVWPYGDGPKLVADEFIRENINKIQCAFVMGGAMFVGLKKIQVN